MERRLISEYAEMVGEILVTLRIDNRSLAVGLANVPQLITGFGHVKTQHCQDTLALRDRFLTEWRNPGSGLTEAAE